MQSARTRLRLKSNAAPRLFRLTVFYRGLKNELVTDFSGREVNGNIGNISQWSVLLEESEKQIYEIL